MLKSFIFVRLFLDVMLLVFLFSGIGIDSIVWEVCPDFWVSEVGRPGNSGSGHGVSIRLL